jgi:3-dehydroquinate dehydratase-1
VDWYNECLDVKKITEVLASLREELDQYPIIFTFRTKAEGGEKEICYEDYAKLLSDMAHTKAMDFIDVEVFKDANIKSLIREIQAQGIKVIGSNHDFAKTPEKEEIVKRLCYMQELEIDIPKIAVMPRCEDDVTILLEATREMSTKYADRPIITMSMGELGQISRTEGELYGSSMTFGSIGKASAPGQIPAAELKSMLEKIHYVEKE